MELPWIYSAFRSRFKNRDNRMIMIKEVVKGTLLSGTTPDDTDHANTSPNLIQVALEDTAESAAIMPAIRVIPPSTDAGSKAKAEKMEKIAIGYLNRAGGEIFLVRSFMDLAAYGFFAPAAFMDAESGLPRLDLRDAVGCYPEPDWKPGQSIRKCIFARSIFYSQLPPEYQAKCKNWANETDNQIVRNQRHVILLEYFDEDEQVVAVLTTSAYGQTLNARLDTFPCILERFSHGYKMCPVTVGQRITLDGEARGQFDQVIAPMAAHSRLMAMAIDYADQSVYSDIWVKEPMGDLPFGGGGVIQLGPNGAIGRVPPAVSSLSLFNELDQLLNTIHLGGRWPKSRPGEISQAIASAKFLETSVGVMNTALRTYHFIMKYTLERVLHIMFKMDQAHGNEQSTTVGTLRNQEFIETYNPKDDIDLSYQIKVEYGLGLGRDPAQSAVLHIQYSQAGMISKEFVQESIEGVNDVERERRRIDVEKFTDMMFGKLMQGVQQGTIPDKALVEMAQARQKGEGIFDIFKKYIVDPAEAAQASGITSGLTGALQQPGGPPAGPTPPGLKPPPAPVVMSRLSMPAGPGRGSFLSAGSGG